MKRSIFDGIPRAGVMAVCLAGGLIPEAAASYWRGDTVNSGTNDYSTAANWSAGVPGVGSSVFFTGAGTYAIPSESVFTVQWSESLTTYRTYFEEGRFEVNFDLNGNTYTNTDRFRIEGTAPEGITLNITGGQANLSGGIHPGFSSGSVGTIRIHGAGTLVQAGSTVVGSAGTGTLHVADGAVLTSGNMMYVGSGATSHGTLRVSGGGAISNATHIYIGDYGDAELLIESGGRVVIASTGHNLQLAHRGGPGQLMTGLITGTNSLLRNNVTTADRGIGLGGWTSNGDGNAHLTVADHGRMESNRRIWIWGGSSLTVDNGTVVAETDFFAYDESELAFTLYQADRPALIQAGNDVTLGTDVELSLQLGSGAEFSVGEFVTLIQYGGAQTGQFKGYSEGAPIHLEGYDFTLTYSGGENHDTIGLHVIPEPATLSLVLLAMGAFLRRRRKGKVIPLAP